MTAVAIERRPTVADPDDFDAFVRSTSGRMLAFARLLVRSPERAEEIVQDAYAGLFRHWDRVRDEDPLNYVRRSIANATVSWWRRTPWRESPTATLPEAHGVRDPYADVLERSRIGTALGRLTRREREVIVLRYFEDLSEADTAAILEIAQGTVKSTGARALAKLRRSPEFAEGGAL